MLADPTTFLDGRGHLVAADAVDSADLAVADTSPTGAVRLAGTASKGSGGATPSGSATSSTSSRPGAARTIYLDFDGATITGTDWNTAAYPSFTVGKSGIGSTAQQVIFRRVAEDYAPFDINVTTVAPPVSDLVKDSATDTRYGVTVVFGAIGDPVRPAGSTWTGIAQYNGINSLGGRGNTAFVTTNSAVGSDTAMLATAASHEVGHTFNLHHDGYGGGYDGGNWWFGPIMGAPIGEYITWYQAPVGSLGNSEDDLRIILNNGAVAPVPDAVGDTPATAKPIAKGSTATEMLNVTPTAGSFDTDVYRVDVTNGALTATLTTGAAFHDSNVDAQLEVTNTAGVRVGYGAQAPDPLYVRNQGWTFTKGRGASVALSGLPTGSYYLTVRGQDATWTDNAGITFPESSRYGSLGSYQLAVS